VAYRDKSEGADRRAGVEIRNRDWTLQSVHPDGCPREAGPFGYLGAARYDRDSRHMARRYKSAHVIQNDLVHRALGHTGASYQVVVDLGCGTGTDGLHVLSKASNAVYVGVDRSSHMLKRAADKISRNGFKNQSFFVSGDFRWLRCHEVLAALERSRLNYRVSCVISALALHHYSLAEKQRVCTLAYDLLPSGGFFVLTDLYSNAISHCAQKALQREVADVRRTIERLGPTWEKRKFDTTISAHHYTCENRPEVLSDEIEHLQQLGFGTVDIVYRHGQLAVLAAQRS
jgi:SAM-dependent methyltransferase